MNRPKRENYCDELEKALDIAITEKVKAEQGELTDKWLEFYIKQEKDRLMRDAKI